MSLIKTSLKITPARLVKTIDIILFVGVVPKAYKVTSEAKRRVETGGSDVINEAVKAAGDLASEDNNNYNDNKDAQEQKIVPERVAALGQFDNDEERWSNYWRTATGNHQPTQ